MNIGRFDLDDGNNISSRRRITRQDIEISKPGYSHDLPRLILFLVMLTGAILGYFVKTHRNEPLRVITRSVEKTIAHSFRASLEGSTVIRNNILGKYRNRQIYSPETGITFPYDASGYSDNSFTRSTLPDALRALELLRSASDVTEHDREDMYGYGTRHFSGLLSLPADSKQGTRIFEYWVNMRTLLAIRLVITHLERGHGTDARGIPINKETYINIRYYDWQ